jgi:3D (Asp-Asp-Asp) domain-containing protein
MIYKSIRFSILGYLIGTAILQIGSSLTAEEYVKEVVPVISVTAEITAYTASVDETDDTPTITASGATVKDGQVACPADFSFGDEVLIMNKVYECQDRMHSKYRYGNYFDIYMETKEEAFRFGRQTLQVIIIDKNEN